MTTFNFVPFVALCVSTITVAVVEFAPQKVVSIVKTLDCVVKGTELFITESNTAMDITGERKTPAALGGS